METTFRSRFALVTLLCVFTVTFIHSVQGTSVTKHTVKKIIHRPSTISASSAVSTTTLGIIQLPIKKCCFKDLCASNGKTKCVVDGRKRLLDDCGRMYDVNDRCELTSIACCKPETCPVPSALARQTVRTTGKCAMFKFQSGTLKGTTFAPRDPFCSGFAVRITYRTQNKCKPKLEPTDFISDGTRKAISSILMKRKIGRTTKSGGFVVASGTSLNESLDTFIDEGKKFQQLSRS